MTVAYSVSSVTVKDGATSADFTVKRSGTSTDIASSSSVEYATSDVSAVAGTDYVTTSGSLGFASGATEGTISVEILSDAYNNAYSTSFLLSLVDYGSTTGTIQPSSSASTTQTYLYLPEDDDSVTVPTASSPGDNLKYQALYSGFSDPANANVEMPLAYLRLGYAGTDMNDYERVILNSDSYHPLWRGTEGDGTPIEWGPMINFALPRNIDRRDGNKSDDEKNNAHLDGVFLYSNANYALSVAKEYSQVIKGNYVSEVEGEGRLAWYDRKADWVHDTGESSFMKANGVTRINGQKTDYAITLIRRFDFDASQQVAYSFGAKYNVNLDFEMKLANDAVYEVHNGAKLSVGGLEVSGDCDIKGNYGVNYLGGEVISTRSMFHQAATESMCLSIQTGYSSAWTTILQGAAIANTAAAVGIAAGSLASTLKSESDFYKMATPDNLDTTYADAFADVIPDASAALALATTIALGVAAVLQEISEVVAQGLPKIEMTPLGLTLSCGEGTEMVLDDTGLYINAPIFYVAAGEIEMVSLAGITCEAEGTAVFTVPDVAFTGNVDIGSNMMVLGNGQVAGQLTATLVEA